VKRSLLIILTAASLHAADVLEFARAALADKLYPIAEKQAERILNDPVTFLQYTDRTEALNILLQTLAEQKRYSAMLEKLEFYRSAIPYGAAAARFVYWKAYAELNSGLLVPAAATVIPVDAPESIAEKTRRIIARAQAGLGRNEEALRLFARIDSETRDRDALAENAAEWAETLARTTNSVEAVIAILDGAAKRLPDNGTVPLSYAVSALPLLKGRYLLQAGQTNAAEAVWIALGGYPRADEDIRVEALLQLATIARDSKASVLQARVALDICRKAENKRRVSLFLGLRLIESKETIAEGEMILKSVIRENIAAPESMRAQLALAEAYLKVGLNEQAAREFRIFNESYDSPEFNAAALSGRAEALVALKRFTEAAVIFRRLGEIPGADRLFLLRREADMFHAAGRYAEAAEIYRKAAEAAPDNSEPRIMQADSLERAGKIDEAEQVLRLLPSDNKARIRLAGILADRGKTEEAHKLYSEIIAGETNNTALKASACLGRGRAAYRLFRFDSALADLQTAEKANPILMNEARFLSVLCLYGLGKEEEAREAGAAYLLNCPDSSFLPDMALWIARYDFNRGRYAEARAAFLNFAKRWPKNSWADTALVWAARAAVQEHDYTGAIELLSNLIKSYPNSSRRTEARFLQAESLFELARFEEAVILLNDITTREPESEWSLKAWGRKGDALLSLGADNTARYAEALKAYREMLQFPGITPDQMVQARFKVGRCLEKMDKQEESLEQYYTQVILKFLSDYPQDETAFSSDGIGWFIKATYQAIDILERTGRSEEALQILRRIGRAQIPGTEILSQWMERIKKAR